MLMLIDLVFVLKWVKSLNGCLLYIFHQPPNFFNFSAIQRQNLVTLSRCHTVHRCQMSLKLSQLLFRYFKTSFTCQLIMSVSLVRFITKTIYLSFLQHSSLYRVE